MNIKHLAMAAILPLVALTAACGTDDNTLGGNQASDSDPSDPCATGTITGAGATFPATLIQQWIKDFSAQCPGATVNYQAVGSGAGIQQFTAGTVHFGASDVPMKPDEQATAEAKHGPVLHIPWTAGGIAVEYRLDGVEDLRLSPRTLAGIYAGAIRKWDDAAIKADNPNIDLPSRGIEVVHRSDGSGTTAVFTEYLSTVAPDVWTSGASKDVKWPTGQGAKGSDGVTAAVKQSNGAIGYSEVSYAKGAGLGVAKIKNAAGEYTSPDAAAVSAALAEASFGDDLKLQVNYTPSDPTAYPISTTSYLLVAQSPADPSKTTLIKSFALYALGAGQFKADSLAYAPLPTNITMKAKAAVERIGS